MHIVCSHGKGESICIKVTGRCLIFIIFGGVIYVLADKSITMPGMVVDLQWLYLVVGHLC